MTVLDCRAGDISSTTNCCPMDYSRESIGWAGLGRQLIPRINQFSALGPLAARVHRCFVRGIHLTAPRPVQRMRVRGAARPAGTGAARSGAPMDRSITTSGSASQSRCASRPRTTSGFPTAYRRDSAYVAVHHYYKIDHRRYFAAFESIVAEHQGRPHWGKLHNLEADQLRQLYPRFDDFRQIRDRLDPGRTFDNAYLRRVLG